MNTYSLIGYVMFGFALGVLAESEKKFDSELLDAVFDLSLALIAGALWPLVFIGVVLINAKQYSKNRRPTCSGRVK